MRRSQFALFASFALVLGLAAQPLVAATYYVGSCKPGAYGSISAAVASATILPGSIIDVCPGTYPEQVVINKALTIQGMFSGNSSQAVITVPSTGLTTTSSMFWGTVAPQVEVTTGPVNITNITVDGTAGTSNCPSGYELGIFYSSGSAGTVNEVETRNQNCNSQGLGILAENGAGAAQSVKIENSSIHDASYAGISTCSNQSTLTTSITGNYVAAGKYSVLTYCNAAGSVSGNIVAAAYDGVYAGSPFTTVSGNTVSGNTVMGGSVGIDVEAAAVVSGNTVSNATFAGIYASGGGSVTSNHIINNPYGIYLAGSGATIKSNAITKTTVGIEFVCNTGTVTGNTINDAATGIDQVPLSYNGLNKFYNVLTARTGGC